MRAVSDRSPATEAILASEDLQAGEECLRCGSLLPTEDEGICPTCGTEFGRATIAMPALKKPRAGAAQAPAGASAAAPSGAGGVDAALGPDVVPQEAASMVIHQPPPTGGTSPGLKIALIAIVVVLLGAVIALVVVLASSGSPPPPGGAMEAPAPGAEPAP